MQSSTLAGRRSGLFPAVIGSGARPGQSCFRPATPPATPTPEGRGPRCCAADGLASAYLHSRSPSCMRRLADVIEKAAAAWQQIQAQLSSLLFPTTTSVGYPSTVTQISLPFFPHTREGEPLTSMSHLGDVRLVALPCAQESARSAGSSKDRPSSTGPKRTPELTLSSVVLHYTARRDLRWILGLRAL